MSTGISIANNASLSLGNLPISGGDAGENLMPACAKPLRRRQGGNISLSMNQKNYPRNTWSMLWMKNVALTKN
jgi:hypothetical protein